jgi:hypothetical protein
MLPMRFSANALHRANTQITIATAEEFLQAPPTCKTIYVTCTLDTATLYRITSFMPPESLVIIYEEPQHGAILAGAGKL